MPTLSAADLELPPHVLARTVVRLLFLDRVVRELQVLNRARRSAGLAPVSKQSLKQEPELGAAARLADAWLSTDLPLVESSTPRKAGAEAAAKATFVLARITAVVGLLRSQTSLPDQVVVALRDLPAADSLVMRLWVRKRDELRALLVGRPDLIASVRETLLPLRLPSLEERTAPRGSDFYAHIDVLSALHPSSVVNNLGSVHYPRNRPQLEWLRATVDAFLHDHHPEAGTAAGWRVATLTDLPWPPQETDEASDEDRVAVDVVRSWFLDFAVDRSDYPDADDLVGSVLRRRGWSERYVLPPPPAWSTRSAQDLVLACAGFLRACQDAGGDPAELLARHRDALPEVDAAHPVLDWLVALCEDLAEIERAPAVADEVRRLPPSVAVRGCQAVIGTLAASVP